MILNCIYGNNKLNIFTDVSVKPVGKKFRTCYGAVAVVGDTIIDEIFRVNSDSTVNEGEAKGVQTGLYLALKYREVYDDINLFSDSLITINNIRTGYKKWFNIDDRLKRFDPGNSDVKNASVYIQIFDIMTRNNLDVNFWHVKGHVNERNKNQLQKMIYSFISKNNLFDAGWEFDFARYLAKWNNYVDNKSRHILHNSKDLQIIDPIRFTANNFMELKTKYINLKEEQKQ